MGALRPNQFGVDDAHVKEYVESVAKRPANSWRS